MINLPNVKHIGLKISGGTDSSLVAYMLANYIIDNDLDIQITPIVIIEEEAPFQKIFSEQVLHIVSTLTGYSFNTPKQFYHHIGNNKIEKMREIENSLRNNIELIVSGASQYPKAETFNEPGGPEENRKGIFPTLWDNWIYTPFINLDKKEIAELYDQYNLLDELFPYTRSCVTATNDFSKHCGKCWWCKERIYGFGKL